MTQFEEVKALLGNSATYYLIAVDMDSNYSYLNQRYQDAFTSIHGNLIGENYAVTMHSDDQETCKIVSQMAFSYPDSVFPATLRKYDGKGGYIITRWEYKAMFDDMHQPLGIFCIGHDITELMQTTGKLRQVKDIHSHAIRKHSANLLGLGKIIQETHDLSDIQDVAKMIIDSATELDIVIRKIYQ